MKWKIGNVRIDNQVVLAPILNLTDSAYRNVIKTLDCGLVETEMISTKAVSRLDDRTKEMMIITQHERPTSLQLVGSNINAFKKATEYIIEHVKPDIIDINMGCPADKIVYNGAGSALLKNPQQATMIIKTLTEITDIPITAKIRSGWDKKHVNAVEVSRKLEDAGVSAITVHPRTRGQFYQGKSNWNIIKEVKEAVSIPVIGNGDIQSCYDAKKMIDETTCDAIMIARAADGNPWIIKQCIEYLEHQTRPSEVEIEEKYALFIKHLNYLIEEKGEELGVRKMRPHAVKYIKGLPGCARIKNQIFNVNTKNELVELVSNYLKSLN